MSRLTPLVTAMQTLLRSVCAPPEAKIAPLQSRDPWTPLLGIVAIALAFLLGWMLGQVTMLGTRRPDGPPLPVITGLGALPAHPSRAS